ncbi:YmaF family protein [Metabacillus arenae]|uniref:YmaF family protein n=1 Tax=Metabacillus arenae TaxID=2771434 RepID=A0A926RVV9_9BACI|nr:YmaF family protein [Metabacillus arenae]MBD1379306.1 hypothetical protein [Metabacillus arenae]
MNRQLVDWSLKPAHAHAFYLTSTQNIEHFHYVKGFTQPVNGSAFDCHTHYFSGITSNNNNHYHRYYGKTGPAIPLPDGSHVHKIKERTYFNYNEPPGTEYGGVVYSQEPKERHDHYFSGYTKTGIGYEPPNY